MAVKIHIRRITVKRVKLKIFKTYQKQFSYGLLFFYFNFFHCPIVRPTKTKKANFFRGFVKGKLFEPGGHVVKKKKKWFFKNSYKTLAKRTHSPVSIKHTSYGNRNIVIN